MPAVLYVTSFSPDLYEASGRQLVTTFLEHQTEGQLLVCTEGQIPLPTDPRLQTYDLDQDAFLRDWLARNADIIPLHLGGKCAPCGCPGSENMHSKNHRPRCPGAYFNRNCSRWFRKVVSLVRAQKQSSASLLVWLDADCYFRRFLPAEVVQGWFGSAACFYLRSPKRKVLESGVIGFHLRRGGGHILDDLRQRYATLEFRTHQRWDDAYQFQVSIRRAGKMFQVKAVDLAWDIGKYADVVPHSPLAGYLEHSKGKHSRVLGIFR